jgi:hypothetical protein
MGLLALRRRAAACGSRFEIQATGISIKQHLACFELSNSSNASAKLIESDGISNDNAPLHTRKRQRIGTIE